MAKRVEDRTGESGGGREATTIGFGNDRASVVVLVTRKYENILLLTRRYNCTRGNNGIFLDDDSVFSYWLTFCRGGVMLPAD